MRCAASVGQWTQGGEEPGLALDFVDDNQPAQRGQGEFGLAERGAVVVPPASGELGVGGGGGGRTLEEGELNTPSLF